MTPEINPKISIESISSQDLCRHNNPKHDCEVCKEEAYRFNVALQDLGLTVSLKKDVVRAEVNNLPDDYNALTSYAQKEFFPEKPINNLNETDSRLVHAMFKFLKSVPSEVFYGAQRDRRIQIAPVPYVEKSQEGTLYRFSTIQVGVIDRPAPEFWPDDRRFDVNSPFVAFGTASTVNSETQRDSLSYPVRSIVIGRRENNLVVDVSITTNDCDLTDELENNHEVMSFIKRTFADILSGLTKDSYFSVSHKKALEETSIRSIGGDGPEFPNRSYWTPFREDARPDDHTQVWNYLIPWLQEYIPKELNKKFPNIAKEYSLVMDMLKNEKDRELLYPMVQVHTLHQYLKKGKPKKGSREDVLSALGAFLDGEKNISVPEVIESLSRLGFQIEYGKGITNYEEMLGEIMHDRQFNSSVLAVLRNIMPPGFELEMESGGGRRFFGGGAIIDLRQNAALQFGEVKSKLIALALRAIRTKEFKNVVDGTGIFKLLPG